MRLRYATAYLDIYIFSRKCVSSSVCCTVPTHNAHTERRARFASLACILAERHLHFQFWELNLGKGLLSSNILQWKAAREGSISSAVSKWHSNWCFRSHFQCKVYCFFPRYNGQFLLRSLFCWSLTVKAEIHLRLAATFLPRYRYRLLRGSTGDSRRPDWWDWRCLCQAKCTQTFQLYWCSSLIPDAHRPISSVWALLDVEWPMLLWAAWRYVFIDWLPVVDEVH